MNFYRDVPPSFNDRPPSGYSSMPQTPKKKVTLGVALESVFCGFRGICPACKKANLFGTGKKHWTMNKSCPNCGVKYEREDGEYIVAMYLNVFLTQILFIIGYFTTDYFFDFSAITQIFIWAPFNFFFPVFFYPKSKGMWAGALFMMGGLYRDK